MSTRTKSLINKIKDYLKFDKFYIFRLKLIKKLKDKASKDLYDYGEGYFYQSLKKINLSGLRDTSYRVKELNLSKIIQHKKVLDIGCNSGFVLLETENHYESAIGIDYNLQLIEIANKVKDHLEANKIEFICDDFLTYNFQNKKFDVILSLANHSTFDEGIKDTSLYFQKIENLLEKDGILIFEGHHPQYESVEKFEKIKVFLLEKYNLLEEGKYNVSNFYDNGRNYLVLKSKERKS